MWLEKGAGLRSPLWRGQMIAPGRAGQQIAPGLRTQTVAPGRGGQMIAPGRRGQRWGMGNADPYLPRMVKIDGIPNPVSAPVADTSTFRRVRIAPGGRGTLETQMKMAELAAEGARDPFMVMEARGLVRGIASKDHFAEADAVLQNIKTGVDYRADPFEVDWLQSPGWTWMVEGQGDCDDMSILACMFNLGLGYGCKFRAVRLDPAQPDQFSHVYPMIGLPGGRWLAQDAVPETAQLGWEPPQSQWIGEPMDYIVAAP